MTKETKASLRRFGRVGLATIIAAATVAITSQPYAVFVAPILNAAAKYLRDKYGIESIL